MKNGKRSRFLVFGSIFVIAVILLVFALVDKRPGTALYSTGSVKNTTDLSAKYASKTACYEAQYAILVKGKTPTARQLSLYRAQAEKLCGIFGRLPAESAASVEKNSPAHKGASVQTPSILPNFTPIAISTPERGKVLISIKNTGGAYTGNESVGYSVVSWSGADPYQGGLKKDYTNEAVMSELGLGKPVGPTAKNIFVKDGVSFLLVTQSNSNIGLRKTDNLIRVCVDTSNSIKESNEGDNCKFQWTAYNPTLDVKVNKLSRNSTDGAFRASVSLSGESDPDLTVRDFFIGIKFDDDADYRIKKSADQIFQGPGFYDHSFNFSKSEIDALQISKGFHTATVCVDIGNTVSETDEANNCASLEFVMNAYPPRGLTPVMRLDGNSAR